MTLVSHTSHAASGFQDRTSTRAFANLTVGQVVNAKVLRKLDEQHYMVSLRGETREARAEHALPVGESIAVVVVDASENLQLRRVEPELAQGNGSTSDLSISTLAERSDLHAQARFYKCDIDPRELRVLQDAMNASNDPKGMMLSGLFLNKNGVTIEPQLLHQLYATQFPRITSDRARDLTDAVQQESTIANLAQSLRAAVESHSAEKSGIAGTQVRMQHDVDLAATLNAAATADIMTSPPAVTTDSGSTADHGEGRRDGSSALHELLSDVDVNGLGVRYGMLPVLINGELVELELVMFKHRQKEGDAEPIKRLMMSIHTEAMGTVSISAEALNSRLLVNISASSVEHAETLGAYSQDVKALAERFGWAVESVAYEVKPQSVTLARRVIEHSIRQGVIDHVW